MPGFLPLQIVKNKLEYKPAWQVESTMQVRDIVAEVAPEAAERLVKNRLTYLDPTRGGPIKAGICGISLHDDHVRVHFAHGAFLKDPQRLLEGDQIAMRFLRIPAYDLAPWDSIRALIQQSTVFRPTGEHPG